MGEIADFLVKSGIQYLSTIGRDGRPKVRPFQFMLEEEGKLYFCTSNQKEVYKEIRAQSHVELCASGENFSWLRLSGKASFAGDIALKAKIQDASPLVKSIYKSPDNPAFEIFCLTDASATIADFSGNPPRSFML
jgi:uncharacterized pyridoxamine 5'-phosphate oxidase family protein